MPETIRMVSHAVERCLGCRSALDHPVRPQVQQSGSVAVNRRTGEHHRTLASEAEQQRLAAEYVPPPVITHDTTLAPPITWEQAIDSVVPVIFDSPAVSTMVVEP